MAAVLNPGVLTGGRPISGTFSAIPDCLLTQPHVLHRGTTHHLTSEPSVTQEVPRPGVPACRIQQALPQGVYYQHSFPQGATQANPDVPLGQSYMIVGGTDLIPAYPNVIQLQAPQVGPTSSAHHVEICHGNHVAARDTCLPPENKNRGMMPFVVECVQFFCIVFVVFFCTLLFIALIIRLVQDYNAEKVAAVVATAEDSDVTDELIDQR
ncbi:hypothetical protein MRX96_026250 [Rhipicephalus microplus]